MIYVDVFPRIRTSDHQAQELFWDIRALQNPIDVAKALSDSM